MTLSPETSRFEIGEADFLLDGEPVRILSGAIHYFRVHPDAWRDRIRAARLMGLNTIETYVAWNFHAPRKGDFLLDGARDLGRFLDEVHAEGMHAIVRPGPYICAEWYNGGLPGWLFHEGATIRSNEPRFLAAVREYYEALAPVLVPRQIDAGGPIVLMQVENEYGAYGNDAEYLRAIRDLTRDIGIRVPLVTIDQPTDAMLADGGVEGVHRTGSFGSRSPERLATLRRHQPTGPLMCGEYWDGWFDGWGEHHHTTDAKAQAADLDLLLASGASANIYMFHGGTNFGFTNGANDKDRYVPYVTSYDYDAPLDERGAPTEKFWAFREVIARHAPVPPLEEAQAALPAPAPAPEMEVTLGSALSFWDAEELLTAPADFDRVPTIDDFGCDSGFSLYRTTVARGGVLGFAAIRDRAQVFLDGQPVGVMARDHGERRIVIPAAGELSILVEDLGRVNYGPKLGDPTGLIGPATLDSDALDAWSVSPVLLGDAAGRVPERMRPLSSAVAAGPVFLRGTFTLADTESDLFLATQDWGRGAVWVNGFLLGRYWSRGPQRTLYVPAPVLRAGENEILVFELHAAPTLARFVAAPDLGPTDF